MSEDLKSYSQFMPLSKQLPSWIDKIKIKKDSTSPAEEQLACAVIALTMNGDIKLGEELPQMWDIAGALGIEIVQVLGSFILLVKVKLCELTITGDFAIRKSTPPCLISHRELFVAYRGPN